MGMNALTMSPILHSSTAAGLLTEVGAAVLLSNLAAAAVMCSNLAAAAVLLS